LAPKPVLDYEVLNTLIVVNKAKWPGFVNANTFPVSRFHNMTLIIRDRADRNGLAAGRIFG